ncbi:MAG: hypothetical protein WCV62_02630 [Candidatus Peribacteraceae bacterium]|jgi:hypothetical protein
MSETPSRLNHAEKRLQDVLTAPSVPHEQLERVREEIREVCGELGVIARSDLREEQARALVQTIENLIRLFRESALPRELIKDIAGHFDGILKAIPCEQDPVLHAAEQRTGLPILQEMLITEVSLPALIEEIRWGEAVREGIAKAWFRREDADCLLDNVRVKGAAQEHLVRTLITLSGEKLTPVRVEHWPTLLADLASSVDHVTNDPRKSRECVMNVFWMFTESIAMDYLRHLSPDEQKRLVEALGIAEDVDVQELAEELGVRHPELDPSERERWAADFFADVRNSADATARETGYAYPDEKKLPIRVVGASRILARALRNFLYPEER